MNIIENMAPFEKVKDKNSAINKLLDSYFIKTDFFGFQTKLPLGVASGPLYNKKYMLSAMLDGFSVITWKTLRSCEKLAHRNNGNYLGHNIVFINKNKIKSSESKNSIIGELENKNIAEEISITNSFGMPSLLPSVWKKDIKEIEKTSVQKNKLIITSVVGTSSNENNKIEYLADDYSYTANCAEESGAKIIEINLSCPNICAKEGSIYKDIKNSYFIIKKVKSNFKNKKTKLLIKVGVASKDYYEKFLEKCGGLIDGIVAINTVPMKIIDSANRQALPGGLQSGVCGNCILDTACQVVKDLASIKKKKQLNLKIIGCGGATSPQGIMKHIENGAEFVMVGTSALFNPNLPFDFANYIHKNKIKKVIG